MSSSSLWLCTGDGAAKAERKSKITLRRQMAEQLKELRQPEQSV